MPQMAPMNWTLLFSIFITLYLITMTLIYFNTPRHNNSLYSSHEDKKFSITWKW
uniref:ATP synthase complex subunit 8 n=1 Tax=Ceratophysella communis TaxID=1519100 RepID=A0A6G6A663_9HEXA|nr:ATP synthase F0 subunit 8 [Ceratophysella communis]QID03189.1 ATP synthase F0 subunit 8 [Ceratophysella communis]